MSLVGGHTFLLYIFLRDLTYYNNGYDLDLSFFEDVSVVKLVKLKFFLTLLCIYIAIKIILKFIRTVLDQISYYTTHISTLTYDKNK